MSRLRTLLAIALTWVGVVVGHKIAYVFAYPGPGRDAHLASTGHDSFRVLALSALVLVPVVLLLAAVKALRSRRAVPPKRMAARLAAFQVPAFFLLELFERGLDVGHTLSEPAVLVGLLIQILVAFASVWALAAFVRGVRALAERFQARDQTASPVRFHPIRRSRPARLTFLVRARRRAPPLSLA